MKEYEFTGKPNLSKDDLVAVINSLSTNNLNTGKIVYQFEKALEKYVNVKHAVIVSNGSVAIYLALEALGIGKGDEVITTPISYIATTNAIEMTGAKPVFADIDKNTFELNLDSAKDKITSNTKAILPVDLGGLPCDYSSLENFANENKFALIIDGAQSLSGRFRKRKAGSFGTVTTTSFHPVKPITTGIGGCIFTSSDSLYAKLIELRKNGLLYKESKDSPQIYDCVIPSLNYQMSDIEAALGLSQLSRIDEMREIREKIYEYYATSLKKYSSIKMQKIPKNRTSSYHLCICEMDNKINRNELYAFLKRYKIAVNYHYPVIPNMYYYKNKYVTKDIDVALNYSTREISLPIHSSMTIKDARYIVEKINQFMEMKG